MKHSAALALLFTAAVPAQQPPAPEAVATFDAGLAIQRLGRGGRTPLRTDPIQAKIVAGTWTAPSENEEVELANGQTRTWTAVRADDKGRLTARGYLHWAPTIETAGVYLLKAKGHSLVYVNGALRTGDPYGYGNLTIPVALQAGVNDLLFNSSRGGMQASLWKPTSAAYLDASTWTLPDIVSGEPSWAGIVAVNASAQFAANLSIVVRLGDARSAVTPVAPLPPLSVRKIPVQLPAATTDADSIELVLELAGRGTVLDRATAKLAVRGKNDRRKVTFRSRIDGSVQYYALNPARPANDKPQALILSLHGASVEATGQAASYADKSWAHLVAATNRRPYGFDWEDWGRKDALEVLTDATNRLRVDPARIYLTGHSMGGHGTWHLGVTYPDRFAAIGPSAGWTSFYSYGGGRRDDSPTPMQTMLARAATPSDTLRMVRNYLHHGVYILHGDADKTVGVDQARRMKEALTAIDASLGYHEQPGAGHWWDDGDALGTGCVDYAPMFDFFARHRRPSDEEVRHVEFHTASPGISSRSHWAGILNQKRTLEPSNVDLRLDPGRRRVRGTTENVARMMLDLGFLPPGEPIQLEIDGTKITDLAWPERGLVWLSHQDSWRATERPSPSEKGPHRYGPFKEAFDHNAVLVFGTRGTPEENAWSLAKARYDAEVFYYRGNGAFEVVADAAFAPNPNHRNVIVYGNADTNAVWEHLLGDSPVQVRRGEVRFGERSYAGDDLSCVFVRPRPGTVDASVGVVAGTGLAGMRLTDRLPYFVSGIAYPDCLVMRPRVLAELAAGVELAGFFGSDWSIERGEFAFAPR